MPYPTAPSASTPRKWTSIAALKRVWIEQPEAAPDPRIEGAFDAVTEDLVDALTTERGDFLLAGHRDLRYLYSAAVERVRQQESGPEDHPSFSLGRLVALLDVAADAVRRVLVGSVEAELDWVLSDQACAKILEALHEQQGSLTKSSDLERTTELHKTEISRKLDKLEARGLVTSRRLGKHRLSRLTGTGAEIAKRQLASLVRDSELSKPMPVIAAHVSLTASASPLKDWDVDAVQVLRETFPWTNSRIPFDYLEKISSDLAQG